MNRASKRTGFSLSLAAALLAIASCARSELADLACIREYRCVWNKAADGSGDCNGFYTQSETCLRCKVLADCEKLDAGSPRQGKLVGCEEVCPE